MPEVVYPIERLSEYVSVQTVELTKDLGDALDNVAAENADTPGIEELLATVDSDPAPLFGLALYVQLRSLANAGFPDEAIGLVQTRATALLEVSLGKPDFGIELQRWIKALSEGWDKLAKPDEDGGWIQHIVAAFEAHYGQESEHEGTIWARLFYLTLIADTYRQNAAKMAEQLKQTIMTQEVETAGV